MIRDKIRIKQQHAPIEILLIRPYVDQLSQLRTARRSMLEDGRRRTALSQPARGAGRRSAKHMTNSKSRCAVQKSRPSPAERGFDAIAEMSTSSDANLLIDGSAFMQLDEKGRGVSAREPSSTRSCRPRLDKFYERLA